jgi:hypothetical protein
LALSNVGLLRVADPLNDYNRVQLDFTGAAGHGWIA